MEVRIVKVVLQTLIKSINAKKGTDRRTDSQERERDREKKSDERDLCSSKSILKKIAK